jgi:ETFB lysine methyltransferase
MTGLPVVPAAAQALRLRYLTMELGAYDIHLRILRDRQQFVDVDQEAEKLGVSPASWPLFGVVWDSGIVLANHMLDFDIAGKRILEVGCGIGLSSLLLNQRLADITATDYNPEAGKFLLENTKLNLGPEIPFVRTGWADTNAELGLFDVIIGSDLLYEPDHVGLLASFIEQHAKPTCSIVLVDPGRGLHARFSKLLMSLGYSHTQHKPVEMDGLSQPFRGQVLHYSR